MTKAKPAPVPADQPAKPAEPVSETELLKQQLAEANATIAALTAAQEEAPPKLQHAEHARSELNPEPETGKRGRARRRYEMSPGTLCEDY